MNITSWLLFIAACAALSGVTWCACVWWYGRKLVELQRKLDKTRKAASMHALQMRHQMTQLQREITAYHEAQAQLMALQARTGRLESEALDLASGGPALPVHGFADTQPM